MNEKSFEGKLYGIETSLLHIEKAVDRLQDLPGRVVALEVHQSSLKDLPNQVTSNKREATVSHAVQEERDRNREELRKHIGMIVTVASAVGALVSGIVTIVITVMGAT